MLFYLLIIIKIMLVWMISEHLTQMKKILVYCTQATEKALLNEFPYVFVKEKYPELNVLINIIKNQSFKVKDTTIIPIEACYLMPVLGFRIKDFVYLTDVSFISEKEKKK